MNWACTIPSGNSSCGGACPLHRKVGQLGECTNVLPRFSCVKNRCRPTDTTLASSITGLVDAWDQLLCIAKGGMYVDECCKIPDTCPASLPRGWSASLAASALSTTPIQQCRSKAFARAGWVGKPRGHDGYDCNIALACNCNERFALQGNPSHPAGLSAVHFCLDTLSGFMPADTIMDLTSRSGSVSEENSTILRRSYKITILSGRGDA